MIETLDADHVRLARAKGLSQRRVLIRHVLRNALIPVTTVVALDFAAVLGGAIITEIVFGWQGLGQWYLNGVLTLDTNVMLAYLLITATFVILFNLLAVLYVVMAWGRFHWSAYALISGPLCIVGILFLLNWLHRADLRPSS